MPPTHTSEGIAVRVITSGKPHQPQDLPSRSCPGGGLVVRPRHRSVAPCLTLCTTAHVTLARQPLLVVVATLQLLVGECRYSTDCSVGPPSAPGQDHELTWCMCACVHVRVRVCMCVCVRVRVRVCVHCTINEG